MITLKQLTVTLYKLKEKAKKDQENLPKKINDLIKDLIKVAEEALKLAQEDAGERCFSFKEGVRCLKRKGHEEDHASWTNVGLSTEPILVTWTSKRCEATAYGKMRCEFRKGHSGKHRGISPESRKYEYWNSPENYSLRDADGNVRRPPEECGAVIFTKENDHSCYLPKNHTGLHTSNQHDTHPGFGWYAHDVCNAPFCGRMVRHAGIHRGKDEITHYFDSTKGDHTACNIRVLKDNRRVAMAPRWTFNKWTRVNCKRCLEKQFEK